MSSAPHAALVQALRQRFEQNPQRHPGLAWTAVAARLQASPQKLAALQEMEKSGGEPDVVGAADGNGALLFCDCAPESPLGRRSLCYDEAALKARKENKPAGSALGLAEAMGVSLLSEAQYRELQAFGEFDLKTSSWVLAPDEIRAVGGAIFCDGRYGRVFTYHNGPQSYYASRGFRAGLRV
ncbi:DUF4256 domain-containing protein [Xylophilus rhododendri]|uniref:DUF4256 domain-containing protein n=1 Tax=Xylophilus rhododendri TaxID=2697032 RepID=A0A857J1K4_9BURK|nr:DUF4256 domain-containing protein [Xylophilus rhododendri]QHI97586.1 DUF4256 domain-containing protein [Xylophilus rhododendri]